MGSPRLAYTEALQDETAKTAIGFLFRARVWFAAHGITRFTRIVTDNGSCYRAKDFTRAVYSFAARHQRTKSYTPRHNGKVERYQRTLANELLYARPGPARNTDAKRSRPGTCTTTTIDPTALPVTSPQPHASRRASPTS